MRLIFTNFNFPAVEEIRFTKMHGIGNDYIYIDCMESEPESPDTLAREMSDRHTGVGGDGIVMICPSDKADFRMRIFNADGSEARMCGNASRCIAKYVIDQGLTDRTDLTLETLSGIRRLMARKGSDGKVESVTVDMDARRWVSSTPRWRCPTAAVTD